MYEWWRFQRYRIYLKKLEIRISFEKLNFFFVHLEGSIQTKLKLDKKSKTRKKIVGWALSTVVCACVWNVRNKPKTWKQKIVRDKIHLLQKVGKKLYTGDKINLLQKVGKSKIKKFRVKLYKK